ncbi:LPS export ABC transporter periplasmic protein LptC [Oleidesulfovibrio sp.]|uniref:LPS export ABC transporter periplasmic protein LptC n=1 Tax=Oleidesulfovibrio sp. TaxID=2909707 RepID=UPI003A8AC50B
MTRRRVYWIICLLVLCAGLIAYSILGHRYTNEVRRTVSDKEPAAEGNVDLALSGLRLNQGEKGKKLWKLDAEKAFYDQQGDTIRIQKPDIVYYLSDDQGELLVKSAWGEIKQVEQFMRLWEAVVLVQTDKTLKTELLIYQGGSRVLTMPDKVWLDTASMNGTMHDVVWALDDNVIRSRSDVAMTLYLEDKLGEIVKGEK